jgi:hypothetical protein
MCNKEIADLSLVDLKIDPDRRTDDNGARISSASPQRNFIKLLHFSTAISSLKLNYVFT